MEKTTRSKGQARILSIAWCCVSRSLGDDLWRPRPEAQENNPIEMVYGILYIK